MLWFPVWIFVHKHCEQSVPAQHLVEEAGRGVRAIGWTLCPVGLLKLLSRHL
jgi:hypothetical protein